MAIAIILAGGKGTRMGNVSEPKQFIDVYGKPILIHTLELFDIHPEIEHIAVVCVDEWHDELRRWIRKYDLNKIKWIVNSGSSRQQSTYNALIAIENDVLKNDIVVIHDSARPLVTHRIITDNIKAAKQYGAVDTVIPTSDTIVNSVDAKKISNIPNRNHLFLGQTPQSFEYQKIRSAHDRAFRNQINNASDDCQLLLNQGDQVFLVSGEKLNFKITTMDDLLLLKSVVKLGKTERI
ncbi:2-C-methyl-D-erythritol 4-phosphate cytidylyltransferase [Paenibacillus sp. MABNR03]|uniref:2-C-methyl-D-erythritol 4-phosphate cytidylyltransferase n=1 Tax=Paenibacillus sp. MABNR03 TaxID=3142626 RepID=UPI003D2B48A5